MKVVDQTIESVCGWIQTELGDARCQSDSDLPEMIRALAVLVSARGDGSTYSDNPYNPVKKVDGEMLAERIRETFCSSINDIMINGINISPEELETIELHQENIDRALSDIQGIKRDGDGTLCIKYVDTGWWHYKNEEWW